MIKISKMQKNEKTRKFKISLDTYNPKKNIYENLKK